MKFQSNAIFNGKITANSVADAGTNTDKFLVLSSNGDVSYRTALELYNDIGVGSAGAGYTQTVKHAVKAGEALTKGQAVYVSSADGTNMIVSKASNAAEATSSKTMGLIESTLALNGQGNVITEGLLAGLDTTGATNAGDPVWLGTGGNLIYGTGSIPYAPAHLVFIGIVTRINANNGEIFVKVQNGFELQELHNVDLKTISPINGHILGYNGTLWVNKTIADWLGFTPISLASLSSTATGLTYTNTTGVFSLTTGYVIPTTSSATNWDTAYTNRITSLTTTGSSGAATLVSNVLNIPTYTLSGLGGQPLATNLTSLSGLTYASVSFVKMTAAGTFALDTNTYLTSYTETDTLASVTGRGATSSTQITLSGAGDNTTTYSSLRFAGYNQGGGVGYHGFFEVQNTYGSVTNGKKFFRLDGSGTLQIINSAYSANIFNLTDAGALTVQSIIKSGGTSAQILMADGSVVTAGTGITISGGTISSSGGSGSYLPLTGGTLTGTVKMTNGGSYQIIPTSYGGNGFLSFRNTADTATRWNIYNYTGGGTTYGSLNFGDGAGIDRLVINEGGAATFSSSVTATSFSNAGLQAGEVFNATKSNAGYFVGYLQNTSATGLGLYIQNGSDTLDAIRIGNAAGTANNIQLYGSGKAYFAGSVGIGSSSPNRKLEVITGNGTTDGIRLTYGSGVTTEGMEITYLNTGQSTTSFDSIYNSNSAVMQFRMKTNGAALTAMTILGSGAITIPGTLTGGSFVKSGGTSSQFLKADGSVDSNTYVTGGPYLPLSGGVMTGSINTASGYDTQNALVISSDTNWTYGCAHPGTEYWMQVKYYGQSDDTRGFRVYNVGSSTVDFRVNGLGNGIFRGTVTGTSFKFSNSTNNAYFTGNSDWGVRLVNDNGYIQFGPANSGWTHIYSDKSFYFNQSLYVNGTQVVTNSGSWGISITGSSASCTGNAATATTAVSSQYVDYLSGRTDSASYPVLWGANQGTNPTTGNAKTYAFSCAAVNIQSSTGTLNATNFTASNLVSTSRVYNSGGWYGYDDDDRNPNSANHYPNVSARSFRFSFVGAGSVGGTGNYGGVLQFNPWDGTTVSTGDSSYQLAFINETGSNGSGNPGLRLRKGIDSTWGSFAAIMTSANYTSYVDAPNKAGTSYYQATTWINFNGTQAGLYWTGISTDIGYVEFYANGGNYSYGAAILEGRRNGYSGINLVHGGSVVVGMYDSAGNGGAWDPTNGWHFYYLRSNACMGINTSTTSSSYGCYVNKGIYSTGDIVAYSDVRKKENIITVENAIDIVTNLRGVFYNRIDDVNKKRTIGVIAQETEQVLPEVVTYASDIDEYGVSYGNFSGLFIEAFKEQQKRIDSQDKIIEELKTIIDGLTK